MVYFDTPGFGENKGADYEEWTDFSRNSAYSILDQLEATVLVVDLENVKGKAAQFHSLAQSLAKLIGRNPAHRKYFDDSMCFVFTHANGSETLDKLLIIVSEISAAQQKLKTKKLASLAKEYPLSIKEKMSMKEEERRKDESSVDWKRVPEDDQNMKELEEHRQTIQLCGAIMQHPDRCILSNPDSKSMCTAQREEVTSAIQKCTPIKRTQLKEIVVAQPTPNLEVRQKMVHLASSYLHEIKTWAINLQNITEEFLFRRAQLMLDIEQKWKNVRGNRIYRLEQRLAKEKDKKKEIGHSSTDLRTSTTSKVLKKKRGQEGQKLVVAGLGGRKDHCE
jgi:hypothetical protein